MKYVYAFREGGREQKYLLGGKGANLAEMTKHGPPGPSRLHDHDRGVQGLHGRRRHDARRADGRGRRSAARARGDMGKKLGDDADPLLVSVRSGAPFSMPGMMDTVLNLGLNDDVRAGPRQADRQRAVRVRLLPPLRADVRQDRARRPRRRLRGGAPRADGGRGRRGRHRAVGRGPQGPGATRSRDRAGRAPASSSPRTRTSSSATRSRPCSGRGTAGGRRTTGAWRRSPTTSAPR